MSSPIKVNTNPSADLVGQAKTWPTWGCGVSRFPWTYSGTETAYMISGEVVITPDGGEPVTIRAGYMWTCPDGLNVTWDVKSPVKKHYTFE